MIYRMHWKNKVTPRGRQYCQLVASARPTSGKDSFLELYGWPTPVNHNQREIGCQSQFNRNTTQLGDLVHVTDWRKESKMTGTKIDLTGWMTPTARDHKDTGTIPPSKQDGNGGVKAAYLGQTVPLCGWPTPRANDAEKRGQVADDPRNGLVMGANLSGWPTPQARDWKGGQAKRTSQPGRSSDLNDYAQLTGPVRITPHGQILTGCSAGMESGGQLNPAHSRWLMGYPPEWDDCGVTAMQSSRK